jgi:hypothetical protein
MPKSDRLSYLFLCPSKIILNCRNYRHIKTQPSEKDSGKMADVTIVYWRDIPAQIIVGKGRRAHKVQLPERFEQAIDRCAMKVGAKDADAYLADWRKAAPYKIDGDDSDVATIEAARLDNEYDQDRIKVLIANDGHAAA